MRGGTLLLVVAAVGLCAAPVTANPDPTFLQNADIDPASAPDEDGSGPAHNDPPVWPFVQDDAGSGGDAPADPVPEVWIEPGRVHQGTIIGGTRDRTDHYAFTAERGDVVHAKARGVTGVYEILGPDGERLGDPASTVMGVETRLPPGEATGLIFGETVLEILVEQTGVHYFVFYTVLTQQYAFSIQIDGEAPEPGAGGGFLPPLPPAPECGPLLADSLCNILSSFPDEKCRAVFSDSVCDELPGP